MNSNHGSATKSVVFNTPNKISAARLLLSIALFVLLAFDLFLASIVVFVVAASTDWVDGYIARRTGQVTQLGRILDPIADKVLIAGVFIYLSALYHKGSGVPAWASVVVICREMIVTALRSFLEQQGRDFSAKMPGKLKMVFQCLLVVFSLLGLMLVAGDPPRPPQWAEVTTAVFLYLAVIFTIYSGAGYVIAAVRLTSPSKSASES